MKDVYSPEVSDPREWIRQQKFDSTSVCAFVLEYEDGHFKPFPLQGCHYILKDTPSYMRGELAPIRIYSSLWCVEPEVEDLAKRYWNFIFDPSESPWRDVLQGSEVIYQDERPVGFKLELLKTGPTGPVGKSTQLIMGLCIASRGPVDHTQRLRSFCAYLDQGFSNVEALYLSETSMVLQDTGEIRTDPIPYGSHSAFDVNTLGLSFKRLSQPDPRIDPNQLWPKPYRQVSQAFSIRTVPRYDQDFQVTDTLKLLKDTRGLKQYRGAFRQAFEIDRRRRAGSDYVFYNLSEAVPILKETKEQWQRQ